MAATLPESFPERKVCSNCKLEKPREEFHKRRSIKKWILKSECKACTRILTREWCKKNPERTRERAREYHRRMASNAKLAAKLSPEQLDVARRMLIDHPEDLGSEGERAAYARGFMAGAQRTEAETKRFDTLKDLCHRIASEGRVYGHLYEERLAAAYESLLAFMRRTYSRRGYKDLEHERKVAAAAIRSGIMDNSRATGPYRRNGSQRYTKGHGGYEDGQLDPLETVGVDGNNDHAFEALDTLDLEPRTRSIIEGVANGYTFKEMGEKYGIVESRACQLVAEVRREHPELRELLLASAS